MSKYANAPLGDFKRTKARKEHSCMVCGGVIKIGDFYYKEHQFLRFLSRALAEICESCYSKGDLRVKFPGSEEETGKPGPLDRFP